MTSRKRSTSANVTATNSAANQTGQKRGACSKCRSSKVRCEVLDGASACRRCTERGIAGECIPQSQAPLESHTRSKAGKSTPLARLPDDSDPAWVQVTRDHEESHTPAAAQAATRHSQSEAAPDDTEEDSGADQQMAEDFTELLKHVTSDDEDKSGGSLEIVGDDSDSEIDKTLARRLQECYKRPKKLPAVPIRQKTVSLFDTPEDSTRSSNSVSGFSIQCTVRRPDGSNAPFQILSTTTLTHLRYVIGEKLGRFPAQVQPQYRLDSDKAKDGMISIQNDEELAMFVDRLHPLIVPPQLANGKKSTRRLKPVSVYFEDAGTEGQACGNRDKGDAASRGGKQAKAKTAAQSGTRMESKDVQEYVGMLQDRWKCPIHTKSPEAPVHCYRASDSVCYALTYANLNLWAFEIMNHEATVDDKPTIIVLKDVRSRSRATNSAHTPPMSVTPPVSTTPPMLPSMLPYGTQYGHGGFPVPVYIHTPPFNYTTPPPSGSGSSIPGPVFPPSGSSDIGQPLDLPPLKTSDTPTVVEWFIYLDGQEARNKKGITFAPFGPMLEEHGFDHIGELISEFFPVEALARLLHIKLGTAICILEYVKSDLEDIRSGKLVFPQ